MSDGTFHELPLQALESLAPGGKALSLIGNTRVSFEVRNLDDIERI